MDFTGLSVLALLVLSEFVSENWRVCRHECSAMLGRTMSERFVFSQIFYRGIAVVLLEMRQISRFGS